MKYIIEIDDNPVRCSDGTLLWKAKGFNSLVFDFHGLSKLQRYEPHRKSDEREDDEDRLVSLKAAIDALNDEFTISGKTNAIVVQDYIRRVNNRLRNLPSAQPEPLIDKEQRIFLAAMGREEKVCEEVDRNYVREPYEDSLMSVCREIMRKVKGALWT